MAAYQPLRDAFREWNRLIIDGQRFDKQHELNQADQRMRERQFDSQLGLQAFNIKMAGARHELAKRGEQRAADGLALQQQINTDRQAQQSLTNARNTRKDKLAEEVHDVTLGTLKSQRDISEANAEKALYDTADVQLDFAQTFGPEMFQDPDKLSRLNEVANARGYEIGEDGLAYDADGSPYATKRYAQKDEVPWVLGRMIEDEDPHLETAQRINEIKNSQDELRSELKSSGTDNYNLGVRAAMKREINKLEGEVEREQQFLTNPRVQIEHYDKRASMLRGVARAVAAQGDMNYANLLSKEASEYTTRAKALAAPKGNQVPMYDAKTGEAVDMASYNTTSGTWKYQGKSYDSLNELPDDVTFDKPVKDGGAGTDKKGMTQNQAMTLVERAHSTMNSKGVPILSGVLEPRLQSTRELVTKYMNEGADNMNASTQALEQIKALETEWWEDRDWITQNYKGKGTPVQLKALASEINRMSLETKEPVRVKSNRMKDLVKEYKRLYKFSYKQKQREMGIKNPYIPNATMRKIQQGMQ